MKANDFAPPTGTAFKFEQVGDTAEGEVIYVGPFEESEGKFGVQVQARIGVQVDGENRMIYVKQNSAMARAIATAIRDSGVDELVEGAVLKLQYTGDRDTGKGNPMKEYRAKITPGNPTVGVADEEPF